ncbi:MAG: ThiF family adenylyltransferase [Pirellulales bacterium]|nr:ThiF family adenylyltransferase [Pirellulales bacterium]
MPQPSPWSYAEAFSRNLGLLSAEEQERLRASRIAIAGMGGVGGVHLATLARLGVGRFSIADPDEFETANFNRQFGAAVPTIGRPKVEVMADAARAINPEVDLRVWKEKITADNVGEFFDGADLFVDGVDFFSIEARRMLFAEARNRGIWSVTAGPIGFGTAWLTFDPAGMSFDRYFDLSDGMSHLDQLVAFAVGLCPRATQMAYLDLNRVDLTARTAPSAGLACQLASGVATVEALKILLGRGPLHPAPHYWQFDPYRGLLRSGRLLGANRNPWQRVKRWVLRGRVARVSTPSSPSG